MTTATQNPRIVFPLHPEDEDASRTYRNDNFRACLVRGIHAAWDIHRVPFDYTAICFGDDAHFRLTCEAPDADPVLFAKALRAMADAMEAT